MRDSATMSGPVKKEALALRLVRSNRRKPGLWFEDRQETWEGEMTAMCTYEGNNKNISVGTDAYYEEQASQEEIYLEETEEELRMVLESDDPPPPRSENPDQQREHAAEELILGDSDDPPLSEETVDQMLRMTLIFRDLDRDNL